MNPITIWSPRHNCWLCALINAPYMPFVGKGSTPEEARIDWLYANDASVRYL